MFTPFAELVPRINDSGTPLATDSTTVNTSFGRRVRVAADRLAGRPQDSISCRPIRDTGYCADPASAGGRDFEPPGALECVRPICASWRRARAGDQASKGADELLTAAPPQGKSRRHGLDPSRKNR